MGAFLDKPKLDKTTSSEAALYLESVVFAFCSMQGWRIDMEDAHTFVDSIGEEYEAYPSLRNWSFIAVFDGHAGKSVAEISSRELLPTLIKNSFFPPLYEAVDAEGGLQIDDEKKSLIEEWIKSGFLALDKSMKAINEANDKERSGTTAICAILTPEYVFFANLGDSRGLLCSKNNEIFATEDHKPYLERERDRIVKAGGSVMIQRVNGSLAVSRALGDFEYKSASDLKPEEQLVSPEPEIYIQKRNSEQNEFLVLACDGIFDVFENRELCDLIRSRLTLVRNGDTGAYKQVVEQILDTSLSKGSRDNMTIILVAFPGAPKYLSEAEHDEEMWQEKTKRKIEELFVEVGDRQEVEADQVTAKLIHDSDFAPDKTGGIPRVHLARSLIHKMISERENSLKFEHPENAELPSATGLSSGVVTSLTTTDGEGEPMESE